MKRMFRIMEKEGNGGIPTPEVSEVRNDDHRSDGKAPDEMARRGLMYSLLAAVLFYFSGGYSEWKLTINVGEVIRTLLLPILFLSGIGTFAQATIPWLKRRTER